MSSLSKEAHGAILRKVATAALRDAREAREKARGKPTEDNVRAAYRACVFAARAARKALSHAPDDVAAQMLAEAKRLDAAGKELLSKLVRMVEGAPQ